MHHASRHASPLWLCLLGTACHLTAPSDPPQTTLEEPPERFVEVVSETTSETQAPVVAQPAVEPPAKMDRQQDHASSVAASTEPAAKSQATNPSARPEAPKPQAAHDGNQLTIAPEHAAPARETSGLGTLDAISPLIGTRGVAIVPQAATGAGGPAGAKPSSAEGLAGLGTRGMGMGSSGFGSAGGGISRSYRSRGGAYVGGTSAHPRPTPNTEHYTDYGVQPFALVSEDALSTFAIDVDTASYAIARRKLNMGYRIPAAAIRVEEFINYFDYDYAPPSSSAAPFAAHIELAPSPWTPQHHILRVGIQGKASLPSERDPVRLTFLVDTSGSMANTQKLPLAIDALHLLVNNLQPHDTVALATYAGNTRAVLPPTPITQASRIHSAIDELTARGGTAMGSGIELAYELASSAQVDGLENRVIVLSDGDANIGGATTHDTILDTIRQYAGQGITMSTIGFGMGNYKDTLMEQLANQGDGNNYYIDSMTEARKVFGRDIAGTIQTIARDVKLQVEFDPASVHAYRLIGYENRDIADKDFRNDKVDAGEIGSGHAVTALYEVLLTDNPRHHLADLRIRAKKPGPDRPAREWHTPVTRNDLHASYEASSDSFQLAVGVATFAEILRASNHTEELTLQDTLDILKPVVRPHDAQEQELLSLIRKAMVQRGEHAAAR